MHFKATKNCLDPGLLPEPHQGDQKGSWIPVPLLAHATYQNPSSASADDLHSSYFNSTPRISFHDTPIQAEKVFQVDSNSSLQKSENILNEKNVKITKPGHAFKCFSSSYNVEILDYFNHELQLKDTESAFKNKLKKLLTELTGFKFVTTLALVLKKIESEDKTV